MQLRDFQTAHASKLLAILRERGVAHDGADTGTGKTYVAAWIAAQLQLETLVICPLSVVPTWRAVLADAGVTATVMNFELAHRRLGKLKPWGSGSFFVFEKQWGLVIFDESHRTSGDTTINSKMLIAAKRQKAMILSLSATAADSVLRFKALGYALNLHSLVDYRSWLFSYGVQEKPIYGRGGRQVLQKNGQPAMKLEIGKKANAVAMARLHEQIFGAGGRGARMRISEIPNFPSVQTEVRLLDDCPASVAKLSDELQTFYKQRNTLAQFSEDEMAKLVHWRMAAEVAKIPHLLDMAEDALETSRVAIFCCFKRTVEELTLAAEKRKWKYAFVVGGQHPDERQAAIDDFQANKLDLIILNIQAGSVGLSLHDKVTQMPRTAIICPSWSATELIQALGRCRRDGGGFAQNFLVYWSTGVEARVASAVRRKLDNLSLLNDAELSEFAESNAEPSLAL